MMIHRSTLVRRSAESSGETARASGRRWSFGRRLALWRPFIGRDAIAFPRLNESPEQRERRIAAEEEHWLALANTRDPDRAGS